MLHKNGGSVSDLVQEKHTINTGVWFEFDSVVVVVVVTLPLLRDRGTARAAIHVHAVDLIELGWGKAAAHFEPVMNDW